MKKPKREFNANCSGQLLIIAALAIAVLISSTTIYVYELSKETSSTDYASINNFILALKQSTRNTMISSLANASNGGEKSVLTTSLNELSEVFRTLNYCGICQLAFTSLNDSNYDNGVWLSWNTSKLGVSSAYANFTLNVYDVAGTISVEYTVNMTTTVTINGSYTSLGGDEKLVNLTCKVYNEGEPTLAKNMSLFYANQGNWTRVDESNNLAIVDYGNGTYLISFNISVSSDSVQVSTLAHDLRDVFVQANTTCYEA